MDPARKKWPRLSRVAISAAVLILVLTGADLLTLARLDAARRWARHSRDVEDALSRLRMALTDAETGQRGYLMTGRAEYLKPLDDADGKLPAAFAEVARLTADNPVQQQRVAHLQGIAGEKMAELHRTVELQRQGRSDEAMAIVRGGAGRSKMEGARQLIAEIRAEEDRLLQVRTDQVTFYLEVAIAIDAAAGVGLLVLAMVLVSIGRDIARREELERALRDAATLRERFVGVLGHDLRNPLQAIVTASDLLARAGLPAQQARAVALMSSSAHRIGRMIQQTLDLTRAQLAGGLAVDPRPGADLAEVVATAARELRAAHPEREIRQRTVGDVTGTWDRDRLVQVASNLLGNALQHGEAAVEVVARDDGATVALEVHNGGAIPPELLGQLFDPFRSGRGRRTTGLGLGLFISRSLVEAHGGTIQVRSSAEAGTTVRVDLPRVPPAPRA